MEKKLKEKIVVSACLLGTNCKYNGKNNRNEAVIAFLENKDVIALCPECLGGLPTPRKPAEIKMEDKVFNSEGEDVSAAFAEGALKALEMALSFGASKCILKEGSPSCGVHLIYDGTFTSKKIPGRGITARLFKKNGLKLLSEEDIEAGEK